MSTNRLEAFSDGMFAVLITIMALEFRAPEASSLAALQPMIPTLLSYILSFLVLAIWWVNHHHLLQASEQVSGPILWANMFLLFWLSFVPFMTAWVGRSNFATMPVALYGVALIMAGIAYYILSRGLVALHGVDSTLAISLGRNWKGLASIAIYAVAIGVSFLNTLVAFGIYFLVAIMWFVPDRRIERALPSGPSTGE